MQERMIISMYGLQIQSIFFRQSARDGVRLWQVSRHTLNQSLKTRRPDRWQAGDSVSQDVALADRDAPVTSGQAGSYGCKRFGRCGGEKPAVCVRQFLWTGTIRRQVTLYAFLQGI